MRWIPARLLWYAALTQPHPSPEILIYTCRCTSERAVVEWPSFPRVPRRTGSDHREISLGRDLPWAAASDSEEARQWRYLAGRHSQVWPREIIVIISSAVVRGIAHYYVQASFSLFPRSSSRRFIMRCRLAFEQPVCFYFRQFLTSQAVGISSSFRCNVGNRGINYNNYMNYAMKRWKMMP